MAEVRNAAASDPFFGAPPKQRIRVHAFFSALASQALEKARNTGG